VPRQRRAAAKTQEKKQGRRRERRTYTGDPHLNDEVDLPIPTHEEPGNKGRSGSSGDPVVYQPLALALGSLRLAAEDQEGDAEQVAS